MRSAEPQFFIPALTVAKVAHHPGKALQIPILVSQRRRHNTGPETYAAFFHLPAFVADMAFTYGPLQLFFQPIREGVFAGIQECYVLANGFSATVSVNALRTRIPGDYLSV